MQARLRNATSADVPAMREIYAESVLHGVASYEIEPPDIAEMERRFDALVGQGYPWIVAEAGEAILGYAYASAFRTRPAYRYLVEDTVYLAPEARGRGIGSMLLDRLVELCSAAGYRQMVAVIGGASPASFALHRRAGFREIGRIEASGFKFGGWLDTVLMQRALGEGSATLPRTGR